MDKIYFGSTELWQAVQQLAGGLLDTTTTFGTGLNERAFSVESDAAGNIYIGGFLFSSFDGQNLPSISFVALNPDGTYRSAYMSNIGAGPFFQDYYYGNNCIIYNVEAQADGKIIVVGLMESWDGSIANGIVRLNSDGTRDSVFASNTGTAAGAGYLGNILTSRILSDGNIVVGGYFTSWKSVTCGRIAKLGSDGSFNSSFTTATGSGFNSYVKTIAEQADNKLIVGGNFTSFNGTTVGRVVRLNSDGSLDTAFTSNNGSGSNTDVNVACIQTDGKILLATAVWNGQLTNGILRLNSDGTRDNGFATPPFNINEITSIFQQADGKILVSTNGGSGFVLRLNSDGSIESSFTSNAGLGANDPVYDLKVLSDGTAIIGGRFTSYNGIARGRLAKIGIGPS